MNLQAFENKNYNKVFWWIIAAFFLFSLVMLYRSTFVGIDGHRHFSLFDDAMISMRYADNLAAGHGLVWNIGQRVEGFTNPLSVFVMALFIKLLGQSGAVLAMQVLGIFLIFANIWLVYKICKKLLIDNGVYSDMLLFVCLLLVICWYPVFYWSIFGMETGMLTTLVLWAVYASLFERPGIKINWLMISALALAYLARPDSLLFFAIFFAFRLFVKARSIKTASWVVVEGIITLLPVIGYEIFRYVYYHQLVPNTYILKATGMDTVNRFKNGLGYFVPFLNRVALFLAVVVLFLFFYVFDPALKLSHRLLKLLGGTLAYPTMFIALFAAFAFYQIYIGGDPWPPFWRMTVPYTVLFFMAFVVLAGCLKGMFQMRPDRFAAMLWLVILSLLVFVPFDYHYDIFRLQPYQTLNNQTNFDQALAIEQLTDSQATVASFWAGTIPFYTRRPAIDPLGKMDPYIAHLPPDLDGPFHDRGMTSIPGHNKYDLNYSFKQLQPDVIVYLLNNNRVCDWGKQDIQDWCLANYQVVNYHGAMLLLKNNSPHVDWKKVKALKS